MNAAADATMTGNAGRSAADTVGGIISNVRHVVQVEIRQAKAEAGEAPAEVRRGARCCAVAAGAVLVGIAYVLLAGTDGPALWLPTWAAALGVGAVALIAAGLFGWVGFKCLTTPSLPRTARPFNANLT